MGGAGRGGQEEGSLGFPAKAAAPRPDSVKLENMDGLMCGQIRFHLFFFVFLAPVKWVDLNMASERISFSTRDVYPQPKVSCYRDGSSIDTSPLKVDGDKERLFSISGVLSESVTENIVYTCSISLGDEGPSFTTSLRKGHYAVRHIIKRI